MKLFFDVVVKELKKSTNIDFEKDLYSKTRDVVTTIEHDHIDSATPMDVDTHITGIEEEKFFGECEEYGQTSGRSRQRAPRPHGKELRRRTADTGKSKEKRHFDGACYNCGKTCHRSRDCVSERNKSKGERKGKGGYTKCERGYKGRYNNPKSSCNHYNGSSVRERV